MVRHGVTMKADNTIVIWLAGEPHIEVRPVYEEDIGAALRWYRLDAHDAVYLFTLRLTAVPLLVRKLPLAASAARRLAKAAGRIGAPEPNTRQDSSPA